MSQKSQDAIDVLSKVIVDTIDKKLDTANFDKSQTGVVTAVNGNTYTISVFGSQYNITSDQVFTVGQSVVVTALQGDMKRLVCSPDNIGTMKTVDNKVKVVGDKLSTFIDGDFSNTLKQIDKIKGQVDESFMSWFYDGAPTNETAPAKDWTTEDAKRVHIGDLYYDTTSGYSYEWVVSDGVYSWNKITDSGIQEALKNASKAQDTADRKRRIFYDTPSTPYDRGDMWAQGTAGDLLICNVMRSITDSYHQTDWIPASKYTDDTKANEALDSANKANGDLASFKIAYDSDLKVTKEEIEARVTKVTYQENVNSTTDALSSLNKKVAQAETTIKQNSDDITLRATKEELLAAKSDAEEDAAEKANTAESNSKKYADSQIKIATDNIQLKVDEKIGKDEVSEAVKSQIEINKDSIASTVMSKITGEEIVSKIEQTPEAVKISAGKIELTGAVTIKNGKTVLDSDAVNNSITQIDGSKIKTGTLDAKKIKAGTITATEIKADTITAGNIATGAIMVLLWKNSSPSSTFSPQDIDLMNAMQYSKFLIRFDGKAYDLESSKKAYIGNISMVVENKSDQFLGVFHPYISRVEYPDSYMNYTDAWGLDSTVSIVNQPTSACRPFILLSSKILELDKIGIDCSVYGENIRVKNMIAAIEGGVVANKTLTAADVAAISGCTKEELKKYFNDTSIFIGYSMHDIQGTIWELKDGLEQIDNFYNTSYSIQTEVRSGTNYVDTNGVHWFGAGVYAIQQNGYVYDATTNKLSLSCLDLTCMLDGTLGGTLTGYATRIPMYERKMTIVDGVKTYVDDKTKPHYIRSSIKETFELSGLTKSMVDYSNRCIPHDLEYSTGTTIWNILTELRYLHYPYEIFFDDDTFVCKEIPSGYDDPVVLDEEIFKSLVISENANVDYSKVHNCIEVWGASNSSNYFCKDKLESNDPEGTGTAKVCKKGSAEWNEIVQLLKDNDLNIGYNMDPNNTGACILLLELTQAEIKDATRISFVCPETLPPDARVVVKNVVVTTKYDSETDKEYKEITRFVYGPMMLFKASVNENGEDEPEDTTKLLAGKYYVIQYGTQYIDQAKEGAYAYKFNPEKGTYEKQELDPSVRYYAKEVYDSTTGRYVTKYYKHVEGSSYDIELTDPSMLVESRVYFIGQSQSHAMAKFVDSMPSDSQIAEDKINEACDNIEYVVVNDPNRTDDLYNSRLTIDKIGRRNLVCSGSEYNGYTSDESAMTVCKYTLWKNCRLTDSITLKMHLIPWLDVNEKVKYAAKYLKSDIAVEWIIKKIDSNIGDGTMNVTLSRYYPYYPHIVSKKTNSYKKNNIDTDTPIIPPAEVSSVIKLGHGVLGRDTVALSSVPGISNTLKTNMVLDYTLLDYSVLDYD